MFIDRLLNEGNAPLLEQMLKFTAQRHKLLTENVANIDTPGYRQKDLSMQHFQAMLRQRVDERSSSPPGAVGFDDLSANVESPTRNILFHDGNNRSIEQLMSDSAKN